MEISIIISGNLTGFSRFYASPNANDLYNEAKFDFDYRNFLTFLSAGDKAYAISFSSKVIAVSLITRILDSFRRPGILVVTALIPRNQLVRGQLNQNDKTAIYRLLNEINDKFYEKNFLNGMINQNPAVLMQDYYSDILSRYQFVGDKMQKPVNARIDITSPNKRIGYVSADESSMPRYLSSLMRKSYEGYHHVFLSPRAPQNIEEPAEEILTYRVRIENDNRPLPGEVRLTDRIPNISPKQGEKDIPNKNFTYGQVIGGEAGTNIIGTIENGDTILLTYRFPREEKTIYFRFYEGAKEIPVAMIRPVIDDANGTSFNIASDSYTFYGKEIYNRKIIRSGNPEFTIAPASAHIDLQRIQNGATININVERGWIWRFSPELNGRPTTVKPVKITLTNKFSGESKTFTNVTSAMSEKLTGNQSDWEMVIESNYYKPIRVAANNTSYRLEPRPYVPQQSYNNTVERNDSTITRTEGTNVGASTTGQTNSGLKISNGDQFTAKDPEQIKREKSKRNIIIGSVATFIVIMGAILLFSGKKEKTPELITQDEQEETSKDDTQDIVKNITLKFIGVDNDPLTKEETLNKLQISFDPSNIIDSISQTNYKISYNPESEQPENISIKVSYLGLDLLASEQKFAINKLDEVVEVFLSVKESDINLYDKIKAKENLTQQEYSDFETKVQEIRKLNSLYGDLLYAELLNRQPKELISNLKDKEKKNSGQEEEIGSGLNDLGFVLKKGELYMKNRHITKQDRNNAEKCRIDALIYVLTQLENAANDLAVIPNINTNNLHDKQKNVIVNLQNIYDSKENIESEKDRKKFLNMLQKYLAKCKSLNEVKVRIIEYEYFKTKLK